MKYETKTIPGTATDGGRDRQTVPDCAYIGGQNPNKLKNTTKTTVNDLIEGLGGYKLPEYNREEFLKKHPNIARNAELEKKFKEKLKQKEEQEDEK